MIAEALAIDQAHHQIIDNRHIPPHFLVRHTSLVFLKGNISAIMQDIFNSPCAADNGKELFGVSFLVCQAG